MLRDCKSQDSVDYQKYNGSHAIRQFRMYRISNVSHFECIAFRMYRIDCRGSKCWNVAFRLNQLLIIEVDRSVDFR